MILELNDRDALSILNKYNGQTLEDDDYHMCSVIYSGLSDSSKQEITLNIKVLDRIKKDRTNILTIMSETNNVINDIVIFFKNNI